MKVSIEFLNGWFNSLSHKDKVIFMAGYNKGYKMPKHEFLEMDDNDDNFLMLWNKNNEHEKLLNYCEFLNIDINSILIADDEKFYFLPYDDKVKELGLDSRMKWDNDSLNHRFKIKEALV